MVSKLNSIEKPEVVIMATHLNHLGLLGSSVPTGIFKKPTADAVGFFYYEGFGPLVDGCSN